MFNRPVTAASSTPTEPHLVAALKSLNNILLGKPEATRLALACLLARGHLLIEDVPGVGKTTLAQALARVLGLGFHRIQFTSDLLPADLLGSMVFTRKEERFVFQPGPLFTPVVLADEVNRATPRTQSALLEAMQEGQISIDGRSYRLPQPFFVIATQNPLDQIGTYPLPESQLDRFALRLILGYPPPIAERALYQGGSRQEKLTQITPVLNAEGVRTLQQAVTAVPVAPALLDYLQALIGWSRDSGFYRHGLSPRAGLMLLALSRAHAFICGHPAVLPADLQAVVPAAVGHRLQLRAPGGATGNPGQSLLDAVAIP